MSIPLVCFQKVIDGESHGTTFEYDPSGLKTKMTYQDGSYRTWAYDDAHNLKSRTTVARRDSELWLRQSQPEDPGVVGRMAC